MDHQRILNQINPHSVPQSPLPEFLFPSLSPPENNARNLPLYPISRPPTDPQSSFHLPDQTLEQAFLGLNLSANYNHHQQPDPYLYGGVNSPIAHDSFLPPPSFYGREQNDVVSFESSRFPNSGMTDFGVGHGCYQTVGSENWERVLTLPNQTAVVSQPRYRDYDQRYSGPYLQSKKELPSSDSNWCFDSPKYGFRSNNNLGDFKSRGDQKLNYLTLKDLGGIIAPLAKQQNASRILQSKFENPSEDEIEMVLSEVINDVGDLMKNEFGNFLIQKLIAVCNEDQRTRIIRSVTRAPFQLICICLDHIGTRTARKLLEYVTTPQQVSLIVQALSTGAAALATDTHGYHVIQDCLLYFPNQDNELILNDIADNCYMVAKDRSGCCVVQACLDHTQGELRKRIVKEIIANAIQLAEDPYGNYVLQHMLGLKIPEATADLVRQLKGNYLTFSCNKYASNVVEKCLTESGEEHSASIIMELLQSPNVPMLLLDPFGNFVIQSALSVAKGPMRNALLNLVQANASSLRNNLYGRKLLGKFDKRKLLKV
ncbi:hypothetical protein LguiB_019925 [Lonicera macranthoides]